MDISCMAIPRHVIYAVVQLEYNHTGALSIIAYVHLSQNHTLDTIQIWGKYHTGNLPVTG